MKKKTLQKRALSLLLAAIMLFSLMAGCSSGGATTSNPPEEPSPVGTPGQLEELGSGDVKWSQETTADGWIKVTNDGGSTLGYSPDSGVTLLQSDGYAFKDMNRNGALDPYEDWRLDAETRAADLAAQLPLADIAGIMLHQSNNDAGTGILTDETKGRLDSGMRAMSLRGLTDTDFTITYVNEVQAYVEAKPFAVPFEAHGEAGMKNQSTWPNNLGMAATFDPELIDEMGRMTAQEFRALGVTIMNTPQMDLATEPRWTRITGTFGEDPALSSDMAAAYTNSLQSTYDENGNDLGWGVDSVSTLLKHFPGDGPGEGGRESHNDSGKFAVYPGDQFYTHLLPFMACLELEGETERASGVMPSYSIAIGADGKALGGEATGSGFNSYKITDILRGDMEFDGTIATDYHIIVTKPWGVEDLSDEEKIMLAIEAGVDRITRWNDTSVVLKAFDLYAEKYGQEEMEARMRKSAERLLLNNFRIRLFENAYLSTEITKATVDSSEKQEAGYEAQLRSITMLKNKDGIIHDTTGEEKPTVYIPMAYDSEALSWALPVDIRVASEYVNVVTDKISDTLTGPADENGNPTASQDDIIRASDAEVDSCDYALVFISSPQNVGGQAAGYDTETEEYIPISLQYRPYTANSPYVRQTSIAGNPETVVVDDIYGAQTVVVSENRSYYGKTSQITNESDLDLVLYATERVDKVIVVIDASNPMVFTEFESEVDAILMSYGGLDDAALFDVATGKVEPSGLLPIQMPANMDTVEAQYEDVPRDMECHVDSEGNTYDFAFGLNWSGVIQDERTAKYDVDPLVG